MTRLSPKLDNEQPTGYVSIHPEDAAKHEIAEGDTLRIFSRRGEMEAPARITRSVRPGMLFLPIHFGENPTNILTSAESFDPLAKIPEFKVSAVRIERSQTEKETEA
jgi:anaerobic selenocysteine-containing dehydrogenase